MIKSTIKDLMVLTAAIFITFVVADFYFKTGYLFQSMPQKVFGQTDISHMMPQKVFGQTDISHLYTIDCEEDNGVTHVISMGG